MKPLFLFPIIALLGLWIFAGFSHPTFERFTETKAIGFALHPGTIKFGIYDHYQTGWCSSFVSRLSFSPSPAADPFSSETQEEKVLQGAILGTQGFDYVTGSEFLISIPFWIPTLLAMGITLAVSLSNRRSQAQSRCELIDISDSNP